MNQCLGPSGRLFGHAYQPTLTTTEQPREIGSIKASGMTADELRAAMTLRGEHYHGHVCTRCGTVVNQPPSSHPAT